MKPKCYMLLGFDRVGKGNIIKNTTDQFIGWTNYRRFHFSAPESRIQPMEQYYRFLERDFPIGLEYVFIDRGFPETIFFEQSRMNNPVPVERAYALIPEFTKKFMEFNLIIVQRSWDLIVDAHLEEIENKIRDANSGETLDIAIRKAEYDAYYEYMSKFWSPEKFPGLVKWVINQPKEYKLFDEKCLAY